MKLLRLFTLSMFLCSLLANGQYQYPSFDVLKAHHVKSMSIYRTPLRFEGGPEEDRKELTVDSTQKALEAIYYFNQNGTIDSIYHYPNENGYYKKDVFHYDENGDMIEHIKINDRGTEESRQLREKLATGGWISKTWEFGNLRSVVKVNADSIIHESLFFQPKDTAWYFKQTFDPKTNLKTEQWRGPNESYKKETYQWKSLNGQPLSFTHKLDEKEAGKKPVHKEKTYALDSTGTVINRYNGRFDDPYLHYNYYERFKKIERIYFPQYYSFTADELIHSMEVSTLYTYTGVELVSRYDLVYE